MVDFKFIQCENPGCRLRMPIDLDQFSGKYCPICGGSMRVAAEPTADQNFDQEIPVTARSLVVLLDNVRSAYNVGAIFRTADGIGVNKVYLCGITPTPSKTEAIHKTALGAEINLPWEYYRNGLLAVKNLKDQDYNLLALERTANASLINEYRPAPSDQRPITLILGNEKTGVDPGIIALCDKVLALPMMGKKASLNVAVAFGAAAYWLTLI